MNFVKSAAPSGPGPFTLVHLSDIHLCSPSGQPPALFFNKRFLSYLSWRCRRRRALRPEVFQALVRAVALLNPDQIAVTGDVTQLGLRAEFEQVCRFLRALGPPDRVTLVPGNHDALVACGWEEGPAAVADYLSPAAPAAPGAVEFPTWRVRGPIALIGLSTARPSAPLLAVGSLGAVQLDRLASMLEDAAARGLFRVVLIHHPPLPGAVSLHKFLTDGRAFRAVVAAKGAELILHGHAHHRSQAVLPGPEGPIPVMGISAASASSRNPLRRAAFRVFRIGGGGGAFSARFQDHVYAPEAGEFTPEAEATLF
jgi:3',5'-cyclic AMP phosphodiesterase CpdA